MARKKKDLKDRKNGMNGRYPEIFEGFTQEHYDMYDRLKSGVSRLPAMLDRLSRWYGTDQVPPQIWALLDLRKKNPYEHIKVWQTIRGRFHPVRCYAAQRKRMLEEHKKNPRSFWEAKVRTAFARKMVCNEWQGPEGRKAMITYMEILWKLQDGRCNISGMKMSTRMGDYRTNDGKNRNIASIDRINSDLPYQPGNIQLVCWWVNHWKGDMPLKMFLNNIKIIANGQGWLKDEYQQEGLDPGFTGVGQDDISQGIGQEA